MGATANLAQTFLWKHLPRCILRRILRRNGHQPKLLAKQFSEEEVAHLLKLKETHLKQLKKLMISATETIRGNMVLANASFWLAKVSPMEYSCNGVFR